MMMKAIGKSLFIAGTISSLAAVLPQVSFAIGLTPINVSDFTLDTTTPSGVFDNAASPTGLLNTTLFDTSDRNQAGQDGFGGFNNFFITGNFLAVGGLGTQTIGSSSRGNNTRVNSQSFTLSAGDLTQDLSIKFDYIFAGYIGRNAASNFNVQLSDGSIVVDFITPITQTKTTQQTILNGKNQNVSERNVTGVILAADLQAAFSGGGNLFVSINVDEPSSSTTTNTVAGFQNISVQSIPFDFDPSLGIGLLGLGFGLNKLRKNLKAKKNTEI
ncbi:MAG: hypothetical protein ACK568_17640 [Pseudanabaena sp.]